MLAAFERARRAQKAKTAAKSQQDTAKEAVKPQPQPKVKNGPNRRPEK